MFTSGILLAAGSANRMGTEKLLLPYKGRPLVERALAPLLDSPAITEVIAVVRPDLQFPIAETKCRVVVNTDYAEGMGSSLRTGIAAANAAADAFVVALADMPEITIEVIAVLMEAFGHAENRIVVPVFQERNGHPVVFDRAYRENLLRLGGDVGARRLIREQPEIVEYVPIEHRGVVYDLDRPEDIELRYIMFDDAGAFRDAEAALAGAGVYFEAEDEADAGSKKIGYHAFDGSQVTALVRGGRRAGP